MAEPEADGRGGDGRPPIDERYRMVLRIGVVVVAYGVYLLVQRERLAAGVLVGAGLIALGFTLVDRYTLWRPERSGLMQTGTVILGFGLVAIGAFLALR
ncbi:MAG: hypothetical protein M3273_05010 [Actinomycetota bacterium]|nr:hypothetical protein [Actinomycetota bacterium]